MPDKNNVETSKSLEFVISAGATIIAAICIIVQVLIGILFQSTLLAVIGGVVCLAGTFFFSKSFANKIVSPVKRVAARMVLLAERGDLATPVEVIHSENEVGVLSRCLYSAVSYMKECVSNMQDGLANVAQGNLTYDLNGEWKGDFESLKTSYDSIILDLCGMFSEIGTASGQVNTGSMQVADGAQMLSHGATQQASSIEELSSQLDDIAKKVDANAYAARNTTDIVRRTTDKINECSDEMAEMLAAIDEIHRSSNEISKIIKVIDDIAFQTNILALNASVEAAHAGAAGKGFAVVADEVRNLAAKSAEAASQTNTLIRGTVSSVEKGFKIARDTAAVLEGIVSGANEISKEITNISEATDIQADAIRRINKGVDQISAVVQNNTSTAEESAAASEELSGQSSMLSKIISRFKYERDDVFSNGQSIDLGNDDYSSGSYGSSGYSSSSDYSSSDSYSSSSGYSSSSDYSSSDSYSSSSGYSSSSDYSSSDNYSSSSGYGSSSDYSSSDSYSSSSGYSSSSDYSSSDSYSSSSGSGSSSGSLSMDSAETPAASYDDSDGDDGGFTPIQFNHADYQDAPSKIILDDDDFINVDSKY